MNSACTPDNGVVSDPRSNSPAHSGSRGSARPKHSVFGRVLVAAAIVLLALNLRVAVSSVGVLLEAVQDGLGMSSSVAGVLTTLPVICFAIAGVSTHAVVQRLGLHITTMVCLVAIIFGLITRVIVDNSALFIITSAIALAGAAFGNVILPPLAKLHFPNRLAGISAAFGAALMGGAALASATTVPLAEALGGWRQGLAIWAALAVITVIAWLPYLGHDTHEVGLQAPVRVRDVARSPIAWGLALVFGTQSAQAYAQFGWFPAIMHDAGLSKAEAGSLLGLLSGIGVPITLCLPWLLRISKESAWLPWFFSITAVTGYLGILVAPTALPWVWATLLGVGGGGFTWTLTMIGRRARTTAATGALSGFTQGCGYLFAGIGPLVTGILHDLTGSWTAPIILLLTLALLMGVGGVIATRPRTIEDDLARR